MFPHAFSISLFVDRLLLAAVLAWILWDICSTCT